jgi:hypothetical protein
MSGSAEFTRERHSPQTHEDRPDANRGCPDLLHIGRWGRYLLGRRYERRLPFGDTAFVTGGLTPRGRNRRLYETPIAPNRFVGYSIVLLACRGRLGCGPLHHHEHVADQAERFAQPRVTRVGRAEGRAWACGCSGSNRGAGPRGFVRSSRGIRAAACRVLHHLPGRVATHGRLTGHGRQLVASGWVLHHQCHR